MGKLFFVCPTTGRKVRTDLEMDENSFADLKHTDILCPECAQKHSLASTGAFLEEEA